ncbi:hypothetical protein [Nesterenkonia aerolata]|uniref:Uncharacterized protein n=1 Tax=Nesterenkonia aerolata TaxID=3074079 RepID=A0ABU2DPH4_9MICC|nr:hypothetical protein [Nesterenkonia sp. LY-0111]MDR8018410.1 hypothetical protein [Nesterenkonia sp. LY-0111]
MSYVAANLESSADNAERTAAALRQAAGHSGGIISQLHAAREVTWESPAAFAFRGYVDLLTAEVLLNRHDAESVADDLLAAAADMRQWAATARMLSAALDGLSAEDLPHNALVDRARASLEDPASFVRFLTDGGLSTLPALLR